MLRRWMIEARNPSCDYRHLHRCSAGAREVYPSFAAQPLGTDAEVALFVKGDPG